MPRARDRGRAITVVLVDRAPLVRERVRALLAAARIEVRAEADDASVALALIVEQRPVLAIVDPHLEGGGLTLLSRVAALADAPRIIVLTAFPAATYHAACRRAGAASSLDKVNELHRLLDVVREHAPPVLVARRTQTAVA